MVIADSDSGSDGAAIRALGSLFKLTEISLWDDGSQVSLPLERSKSGEADGNDNGESSDLVPDWSALVVPEDLELNKQMSELGLPLSFHTSKEKSGLVKSKRNGTRSKQRRTCPVDEVLYEVSTEEVVSPAELHDKTISSLSCISMLGQSESCYCDGAMEVDMTRYASGKGDNSACCTGFANDVSRQKDNTDLNETAANDAQEGVTLISNIYVDSEITEHGEIVIGSECLDISSIVCKEPEFETICNDDGAATWQPQADESESVPVSTDQIGYDHIDLSNNCGEFGDWMVFWDTFYNRKYFYNIKTQMSTWEPPPGMEHLAIGEPIETNDSEALKAAEGTKAFEETLVEGKQLDEYSAKIGVPVGNLVTDITAHSEGQSVDHSGEFLERSSCDGGVSCSSVSNTLEHIISSNERGIQAASEVTHQNLETMVIDIPGLDTESDPSTSTGDKKWKRRQRQIRKSYIETGGFQFEEMPEKYSPTVGKYWYQRYNLFSRFDDGVKMDEEGWFSVTPEAIARYQAERCASGIIIDCFVGVGGNAIQFANMCRHVIAIDIDPLKIDCARHNAAIYKVDDKIEFITGDFFVLAPKLKFKADTVFLSPPWGGPDYAKVTTYDMKTMLRPHDGYTLFNVAKEVAPRVVMFLPRNVDFNQLAEISLSASPPWSLEVEKVYLNGKLKAITAYFSDTAVVGGGCRVNKHIYFDNSD